MKIVHRAILTAKQGKSATICKRTCTLQIWQCKKAALLDGLYWVASRPLLAPRYKNSNQYDYSWSFRPILLETKVINWL